MPEIFVILPTVISIVVTTVLFIEHTTAPNIMRYIWLCVTALLCWWCFLWMIESYEWKVDEEFISNIIVTEEKGIIRHYFRQSESSGSLTQLDFFVKDPENKQIKYITFSCNPCYLLKPANTSENYRYELTVIDREQDESNN